jgi:hypothetical protein
MTNIEVLSSFFKLFEIFGLQYFSFKDLDGKTIRKQPEKFYKFYFSFVLIFLSSGMTYYVAFSMKVLLIAGIFFGILESFVKNNQLKEVYMNVKEISTMCLVHFDYVINYKTFRKVWRKKFYSVLVMFTIYYGSVILQLYRENREFISHIVGFFPLLFFGLIIFKFTLHVDLVNFQLNTMHNLMKNEVFLNDVTDSTKNPVNIRHVLQSRSLALRKIYNLIFDTAQIVNNFLLISTFLIIISTFLIIINTSFLCIRAITIVNEFKNITRKFDTSFS